MQRFGRSDQRWRDRWGGGFVIVTVLALAGAWWLGNFLADRWGPPDSGLEATNSPGDPAGILAGQPAGPGANLVQVNAPGANPVNVDLGGYPRPMKVFFVQAHAFNTAEKANQAARGMQDMALPAAVMQRDGKYVVVMGAYGSLDAARASRDEVTNDKYNLKPFVWSADVKPGNAARLADTKADAAYRQGLAALNAYMHEAAIWFDSHARGQAMSADYLNAYATQVRSAADQLKGAAAQPAVADFLGLAQRVAGHATQIAGMAGDGAAPATAQSGQPRTGAGTPTPAQFRTAMSDYVALVNAYMNWIGTPQ